MRSWKVGELAKRTGISVRTLHHYDELGLLSPARRDGTRYRLYSEGDLARLQQILSLRQLGFRLEEIRQCLASPDFSPLRVVEMHLARLREQIGAQQRLQARLEALAEQMRSAETVSADEFIQTVEMMTMFEKYYTPEQLQELEERRLAVGEERMRQSQQDWAELMAEVRTEMERGTDPKDERVRKLAERWTGLVREFTGGNPGIEQSLKRMYQQESNIHGMEVAPMRELGDYISKAFA
jgi:MerR family transcriptional regulator, thiopeptide resistance regulator